MGGGQELATEDSDLKEAFKLFDTNGDERLSFDEFYALLKKGISDFPEVEATELFREADRDGSGSIEFGEFVDYIYGNLDFREYMEYEITQLHEEETKKKVLKKSLSLREEAKNDVKRRGEDWKQLSWKQRLEEVVRIEEGHVLAPPVPPERPEPTQATAAESAAEAERAAAQARRESGKKPKRRQSVFQDMGQSEIVDHCIHRYDLSFAARERPKSQDKLCALKEQIRKAGGPEDVVNIKRFLAKGTAGWVFEVEWKASGERAAMKVIRMSQSLSGIKEWFVSKCLKDAGVDHAVYTMDTVRVVDRDKAPAVIKEQLLAAGPVNFYLCCFQAFMGGGDLEGLQQDGRLTPKMMFAALVDVSSTLAKMHSHHIAHRDIKPENVMVEMDGTTITAAKLCDFGSATFSSNDAEGAQDDVRRFGVTLFSLATGETWTKHRLIHAKHDDLVARMEEKVVGASDATSQLPALLRKILDGHLNMAQVAEEMKKLSDACSVG